METEGKRDGLSCMYELSWIAQSVPKPEYKTIYNFGGILLFLWFDPFQNTVNKPSRNTLFYQFYFIDMVLSHSISFPLKIRYLQKFEKDLDNWNTHSRCIIVFLGTINGKK